MNNMIKNICIFTAGVVTGYAITNNLIRNHYADINQEEFMAMKEYYEGKSNADIQSEAAEAVQYTDLYSQNKARVQYDSYSAKEKPPLAEVISGIPEPSTDSEIARIITVDEFSDEQIGHTKETLLWYPIDGVLTDDTYSPMIDKEGYLGSAIMSSLRSGAYSTNPIYIRNELRAIDFEIVIEAGSSYERDVLENSLITP